jgi:hypothetical protein
MLGRPCPWNMLSPQDGQALSSQRNLLPITNACAGPPIWGCTAYDTQRLSLEPSIKLPAEEIRDTVIMECWEVVFLTSMLCSLSSLLRALRYRFPSPQHPVPRTKHLASWLPSLLACLSSPILFFNPLPICPGLNCFHPLRVIKIPFDGLSYSSFKGFLWRPAQFLFNL